MLEIILITQKVDFQKNKRNLLFIRYAYYSTLEKAKPTEGAINHKPVQSL